LALALEIGVVKAKELAKRFKKPVIAVNHMAGHLLSSFARNSKGMGPFSKRKPLIFPFSFAHTIKISARGLLVIQAFDPLRIYPFPLALT